MLCVVDDLDLVGGRRTDAGQPDVLVLDLLVREDLLHVHVDLALDDDGGAVGTRAGPARERPVVALCLGGFEDVLALVDVESAVILVVEAGVGRLLEDRIVVHVPALVVHDFVVKVLYGRHQREFVPHRVRSYPSGSPFPTPHRDRRPPARNG